MGILAEQWRAACLGFLVMVGLCACGGGGSAADSAPTGAGIGTIYYVSGIGGALNINPALGTTTTASINSTNTGRTYAVNIYVPAAAASSQTPLPVLYSADAQYLFSDLVASVQADGVNAYVVSVNYVDSNERATDYLYPGARAYFNFFAFELLPSIEAQYNIDPTRRTLFGYSYSGVFAFLAMFYDDPASRLFSGIVPIDGSFFTDVPDIDAVVQQSFAKTPSLPVNLYMSCSPSQGSNPGNCNSALPLFQMVGNQGFKGVGTAQLTEYVDADHSSVVSPSIQAATMGLFPGH